MLSSYSNRSRLLAREQHIIRNVEEVLYDVCLFCFTQGNNVKWMGGYKHCNVKDSKWRGNKWML